MFTAGLRYLEYYEFRLVREALIEREVLLRAAPHIIWPMRFVLPHSPEQRPAWMVRAGLFLYDHLGGRKILAPTRSLDLIKAPEGEPLRKNFSRAFEYSDCWVDDARLVVLNALDVRKRGGTVLTRTPLTSARRVADTWRVDLRSARDGNTLQATGKILVNAAGPWVEDVLHRAGRNAASRVRLVKGSHIVTRKFWSGDQAYLLQNSDKRVIFVNPYEGDLALIGTTDIPFEGRAEDVRIEKSEVEYLLSVVDRYFTRAPKIGEVVDSFSGVRPLFDDKSANPSAVTRDYVFDVEAPAGQAPMLSVFGGKITTYRRLAEHALEKLSPYLPQMSGAWTERAALPGGDIPDADFSLFLQGAAPAASLAPAGRRARLCPAIRDESRELAQRRQVDQRPRASVRRNALRARGPLPCGGGMGDRGRRYSRAADETCLASYGQGARRFYRLVSNADAAGSLMTSPHIDDSEFHALRELSAALGADPLRTQGAGGNTSIKRDGVMWIKASGTWLADALAQDIMTPVRLDPLRKAIADGDPRAAAAVDFVDAQLNASGLRPSIETSVHAIIPSPVVVHIHCVNTIALAVRHDGESLVARTLEAACGRRACLRTRIASQACRSPMRLRNG